MVKFSKRFNCRIIITARRKRPRKINPKMSIQRALKKAVKIHSHVESKVREATSNDPCLPPTTLMAEIAELTCDVLAFTEIMPTIWKRMDIREKKWRHVYKSLVLLHYIFINGSDRVLQQCRENLLGIQVLADFQYVKNGEDYGLNVRDKSKQLIELIQDDDRIKNERTKVERFSLTTEAGGSISTFYSIIRRLKLFNAS